MRVLRWVNVGAIKGGSAEYCAAGSAYIGPCRDEVKSFVGASEASKKRWSEACKVLISQLVLRGR